MPAPVLDRSGAPMLWVNALGGYLHLLPVTKLQIEFFLCEQPSSRFDQKWYEALLSDKMNPRVPPPRIAINNYHNAFLTGIRPSEVQAFIQWNNDDYRGFYYMPTDPQWTAAFAEIDARPTEALSAFGDLKLTGRMRTLLERLQAVAAQLAGGRALRLSEQMFMRRGVMEWVEAHDPRKPSHGGRGEPAEPLGGLAYLTAVDPDYPLRPEEDRLKEYGFRLLRKES